MGRSPHKLFRPPIVSDYVERGQLEQDLASEEAAPIIVVTAPAGYGKSSLVSHWLDQTNLPHLWLALDHQNNEFREFLTLLAEGLGDYCSVAANHLSHYCEAQELPQPDLIANTLSADLDEIAEPYVLVLDDYHNISDSQVHEFIDALLQKMPRKLRIAIISRRSTPLTLGRLRAQNLVVDIRMSQLRLKQEEGLALVESVTGSTLDATQLGKLQAMSEGWPVGIRLLLLACHARGDLPSYLDRIDAKIWQIQEYLLQEVLNDLPKGTADALLRTAILNRFSADLCDVLMDDEDLNHPSGKALVEAIYSRNLFCIPLSQNQQWYRYHHLFQQLLQDELSSQYSETAIRELNRRAAEWYEQNDFPEESIYHYLEGRDPTSAGKVVGRIGEKLKNNQEWLRLDRLLRSLPTETVENSVDLLLLDALASDKANRISQYVASVERAEALYYQQAEFDGEDPIKLAQICATRSTVELHFPGRSAAALKSAQFALDELPADFASDRSMATIAKAYALQTLGDASRGVTLLREALQGKHSDSYNARILFGMCFVDWASGDLAGLCRDSKALRDLGDNGALQETYLWATWLGGAALYQLNDLDASEATVQHVVEDPWPVDFLAYAVCVQIQALTEAARGELSTARQLAKALVDKCLSSTSRSFLFDAEALQAQLAWADGDVAQARRWALDRNFDSPIVGYLFSAPGLTAARILMKSDSKDTIDKADRLLGRHTELYESTHNTRFLIETLTLRSLLFEQQGNTAAAVECLDRAICLAEPGGFIRIFVDIGPELVPLLNRLDLNEHQLTYVGQILAAFQNESDTGRAHSEAAGLTQDLSARELEVLELLAQHLTNKEIGERLYISPATVKRHTQNIFAKLDVSSRHAAAAKAIGLGLVPG